MLYKILYFYSITQKMPSFYFHMFKTHKFYFKLKNNNNLYLVFIQMTYDAKFLPKQS